MELRWGNEYKTGSSYCWWFEKGGIKVGYHQYEGMLTHHQGCASHHSFTTKEDLIFDLQYYVTRRNSPERVKMMVGMSTDNRAKEVLLTRSFEEAIKSAQQL